MADRSSRFYNAPTYAVPAPDRKGNVVLYQPRLERVPPTDGTYRVRAGDRLDLIAHTLFGDPFLYWRLADANPDARLDELAEPGRTIAVPERR
jgi:nucleoid-associated protein YgaU